MAWTKVVSPQEYPEVCGPVLSCPRCQEDYLHQYRVEVFDRRSEDTVDGLHVIVEHGKTQITTDMDDNPSGRRQGLRIYFGCEHCCAVPVLSISQHKGNTFMRWQDRHGDSACGPDCTRYPSHGRSA
jgi:hypothetical protein